MRAGASIIEPEAAGGAAGVVPTCYSIGVSEFTRWLAKAAPRDEIVYAHGTRLDGKRDVAVRAREAQARCDVTLYSRRQPGGTSYYIARRVASERVGKAAARPGAACLPATLSPEAAQVLAMLSRCADAEKPCPTNRQIAVALRINDGRRVRYLVDRLERGGLIRVEGRGQRITRIVTITATGQRTSAERTPVGLGFEKITPRGISR